jgi:hypothetical protein
MSASERGIEQFRLTTVIAGNWRRHVLPLAVERRERSLA